MNENFISSSAFSCMEINAYSLIHLILKLRNSGKPELFLPMLFDSQPCERTFRQMRSMGTVNWTKINFTLQDLLHLISRVELQNDIVLDKLAGVEIKFPRFQHYTDPSVVLITSLPSNEEIISIIKKAQQNAVLKAASFGMNVGSIDILSCQLRLRLIQSKNEDSSSDEEMETSASLSHLNMLDYSQSTSAKVSSNKFIEICEDDGTIKMIRKSSIVWLLSESPQKLSNDRLKRVQSTPPQISSKRIKVSQVSTLASSLSETSIYRSSELRIGCWCYFF